MKDASNIGVTGCIDAVHMAFMASREKRHSRLTNVAYTVCVSKAFHCLFKGFHVHEMKYRWNPILLLIWYKFSLYRFGGNEADCQKCDETWAAYTAAH